MTTEFHKEMSKLYKEDPKAFKKEQIRLTEELIQNAPDHLQLKLRLSQVKWDKHIDKIGSQENRLSMARALLMTQFIEIFNPTMQELAKGFKK